MRIGIMMRAFNQHGGGVKVYTRNLVENLLQIKNGHEYYLIYNDPGLVGTYANASNTVEIAGENFNAVAWDQQTVPAFAAKYKLDIIFNPKYSVPLFVRCPAVFVCHGLDWYVMPWGSKFVDRLNHKLVFPLYVKKARKIIAVSEVTRLHLIEYLKVNENKIQRIYPGVDECFRQKPTEEARMSVRQKYDLPEKYLLYVGQIYPPKNFGRLIQAFARVGPAYNISLVIAGEHRWLCQTEIEMIEKLKISKYVRWTGWIGQKELPVFYAMASGLLMPSLYESCGFPLIEAMSAGCPVVTSDRFGTAEMAGDNAILVNPESVDSIASGIVRLLSDEAGRDVLAAQGKKRSLDFNWKRCAGEILQTLETAAG